MQKHISVEGDRVADLSLHSVECRHPVVKYDICRNVVCNSNSSVFIAVVFKDYETAEEVMAAKRPVHQKKLGRQVRNYDQDEWNTVCKDVVRKGNIAKVRVTNYQ